MTFENNVFINCPFDDEYKILLRPMIFCLLYFDLNPQISQTNSSAKPRIASIIEYIKNSKYSIHDISRSLPLENNKLPRFNLPFELGLDIGSVEFGEKKYLEKKIIVLEKDPYNYQEFFSDIAGQDIEYHNNDPEILILKIRNWLSRIDNQNKFPSGDILLNVYIQFSSDNEKKLLSEGFSKNEIDNLQNSDFIKYAKDWIKINKFL